ncbi:MAG: serine--tRNA ligase, partial [bacterium]|nr:serine--tRNA ligase [bacterium]
MLDIQFIRENADKVKKATKDKGFDDGVIDRLLKVDIERRKLMGVTEELRAKRNKLTKDDIEKGKKLKVELKEKEESLNQIEKDFTELMFKIPNPPAKDVKEGKNETENEIVRKEGSPTKFSFKPKDHLELGEKLGVIDTIRASKVSGTRFGYLMGDGARL